MNFVMVVYQTAYGLSFAAASIVGRQIGRGQVELAKKYYCTIVCCVFIMVGLITLFI